MLLTFTIPQTGTIHEVQLKDELVQEYKLTVQEMAMYFSPSLDKARRVAHNKCATPIVSILAQELNLPEQEVSEEARHIVTAFLEPSLTGQSKVRDLRMSGLLL